MFPLAMGCSPSGWPVGEYRDVQGAGDLGTKARVAASVSDEILLVSNKAERLRSTDCGHSKVVQYRVMGALILPASWVLYIILPAWMLSRGWLIRAGIAMIFAALLPWAVWFLQMPERWGPGAGMVLMLTAGMLLTALVPIGLGIVRAIRRSARASQKRAA